MSANRVFTKENLDSYLKELAKEFRKLNSNKIPAEIILIGGASVLINYVDEVVVHLFQGRIYEKSIYKSKDCNEEFMY